MIFKFIIPLSVDPKHHHITIDNYQTSSYHNQQFITLACHHQ